MSRDLTPAAKTESQAGVARPFLLCELDLDGGAVRVNNTDRDLTWGGNTYTGVGDMGKVSAIQEATELQASGVTLELSGIPGAFISMVLNEDYQGREATLWLGFFDSSYQIVADPLIIFRGPIDQMSIRLGNLATISLRVENELIVWERPNVRRYTNADQQERFPGDKGLEFVPQAVEKEILWGRTGMPQ